MLEVKSIIRGNMEIGENGEGETFGTVPTTYTNFGMKFLLRWVGCNTRDFRIIQFFPLNAIW